MEAPNARLFAEDKQYMYNTNIHIIVGECPMKASIVDLRYHMHNVIKALDRNESVEILYHRKKIGVITPIKAQSPDKVQDHPFFGIAIHNEQPVEDIMQQLRGGRYNNDI